MAAMSGDGCRRRPAIVERRGKGSDDTPDQGDLDHPHSGGADSPNGRRRALYCGGVNALRRAISPAWGHETEGKKGQMKGKLEGFEGVASGWTGVARCARGKVEIVGEVAGARARKAETVGDESDMRGPLSVRGR